MAYTFTGDTGSTANFVYNTAGPQTITFDTNTNSTWDLPDPLIDWIPYKWKKYFPTWHLVRSYK